MAMDGMDNKVKNLKAEIAKKKAMKGKGMKSAPDKIQDETRPGNPFIDLMNPKGMREKYGYTMPLRKGRKIDVEGKG